MKVALTGHSKGIGAALVRTLTDQGHIVMGYDLTNNYDITQPGVIDTIAARSVDCDVFINNAYADISQTLMLEAMISQWEHTAVLKTIVNISSKMSLVKNIDGEKNLIYKHNKIIQNKITRSRIRILQPQILNIIPGFIDTQFSADWPSMSKIDPDDFAQLVVHLISLRDKIQVQEIIIDAVPIQESNTNAS
jgi:NADP-dependent 3-hydroxy acid dehydrogenase YdfG